MALSSSLFYTLNPSEGAILFYPFGDGIDKENVQKQGFHMKAPWNDRIIYDVSEISSDEIMDITDKNGLPIHVDVTVRFSPQVEKIGFLHERFKGEYKDRFVIPEARSITRQIMAQFTAEEIYSTKRAEVEATIKTETEKKFSTNYINFIDIRSRYPIDATPCQAEYVSDRGKGDRRLTYQHIGQRTLGWIVGANQAVAGQGQHAAIFFPCRVRCSGYLQVGSDSVRPRGPSG